MPTTTHTTGHMHTRRTFLRAGATTLSAVWVVGCDVLSTEPSGEGGDDRSGATGNSTRERRKQAPSLDAAVESGDLPTVEKRLPDKPVVVEPLDGVGRYGGTWHGALRGPSEAIYLYCLTGYDQLLTWKQSWTGAAGVSEVQADIAERFEIGEGGAEYTFWLRKGMKWSDGAPFTADDVVFAINDVYLNESIFPVPPSWLSVDGAPASIEKLDAHSFRIAFSKPSGLFPQLLAKYNGYGLTGYPRHYLEQFHKKYNPSIDELVEKTGQQDWMSLFAARSAPWGENPDLPTLAAWRLTVPFGETTRVVVERNPYYWKVDPDGRQLPYIDKVVFDIIGDPDTMLLAALNGEIDLEVGPDTRFTSAPNKPVLARNRGKGKYRFVDVDESRMNEMLICFNLAHPDPVKRQIFGNKQFRVGLSHAIDRKELSEVALQHQGEPYQAAPLPSSPFHDEEFATQYLAYDPDLANEHLDRAGFSQRDSSGTRLGPDGNPIMCSMEFPPSFRPVWTDMLELVRGYWRDVGVEMTLKPEGDSLWEERMFANKHDVTVWHGDGGLAVLLSPKFYFPLLRGSIFAVPWGDWYNSGGTAGEKPPDAPLQQMRLYNKIQATAETEEQTRLMKQILKISKEQFYVIGTVHSAEKYFIAGTKLKNIPNPMIQAWHYPTPGPTRTCQYWIRP